MKLAASIAGDELRIRALEADGAPPLRISEGNAELGVAAVQPDDSTGAREYRWKLVRALFDGKSHVLCMEAEDAKAYIAFVGDPALVGTRSERTTVSAQHIPTNIELPRRHSSTLQDLLNGKASGSGRIARRPPLDILERYGMCFPEATRKRPRGDVIFLSVINYKFRIQRPQHLAMELADAGARVFFVSINLERADDAGHFHIEEMPHPGVFLLRLRLDGSPPKNIYSGFSEAQIDDILQAVDEALLLLNITEPTVVVEYPSWHPIAAGIPGALVIHDCLDYVGGFSNVPPEMVELEGELLANADLVVTTSAPLAEHVAEVRESIVIRNAADVEFFARAGGNARRPSERPLIGYFGAIAEWYEVGWVEQCARSRPEWDFVLIGQTTGANVEPLATCSNVRLLGEQPYNTLPERLAAFDVAIIPFHINDLIRCTNPVKLYEYMAAGKPVVASPMPEVVHASPLVYIAHDAVEFQSQIARALADDNPKLRRERATWATEHTWSNRVATLLEALPVLSPRVSVVILAYNNWAFTQACLNSVLTHSDYSNLEVIVVDNGSTDQTPRELAHIALHDSRVRPIRCDRNLGFAAGNNVGIRAAQGEYVILLNNDTYATRGWVRDLIRPLMQDRGIGLAGPLTNNIGNEQKIRITYEDMPHMAVAARRFTRRRLRARYTVNSLAFFCVATRRDVIERIGLLDEAYGRGFFEDDDYCRRVQMAGYEIVVVDDVFIHHELSATFDKIGAKAKRAQMERNRALYERKWGPWVPHAYRDAPGFG